MTGWTDEARAAAAEAKRMQAKGSGTAHPSHANPSGTSHLTYSQATPRTIVSRERSNAEAIVAKYARFPGVVANELTRARQTLNKYAGLEARAARADQRIRAAFKSKYGR